LLYYYFIYLYYFKYFFEKTNLFTLYKKEKYNISLPYADTLTSLKEVKPFKGKIGDKEKTLYEVKTYFLTIKENYKFSNKGSSKEFCLLANGF
jgi:hypothetical protein